MCRVVQCMQNRACAQEEQRFKEGMGEKVEHAGADAKFLTSYTQTDKHIAKLADRREGQYAFEVALHQRNCCCKQSGQTTNPGHHIERDWIGGSEQWICARNHIYTGRDH